VLKIEAVVAKKLYAVIRDRPAENFALFDKIPKICVSFIALAHILPRLQKNPLGWWPLV